MEIWKDLNGEYGKYYQVSNKGNVLSKRRNKIMSMSTNGSGHNYISLKLPNEKKKHFFIHRLVAEAFVPNPDNKPYVLHKVALCKGGNNSADNLYWGDQKQNVEDSIKDNTHSGACRPKKKIAEYNPKTGEIIQIFESTSEADRLLNLGRGKSSAVARGLYKSTKGHYFKYLQED